MSIPTQVGSSSNDHQAVSNIYEVIDGKTDSEVIQWNSIKPKWSENTCLRQTSHQQTAMVSKRHSSWRLVLVTKPIGVSQAGPWLLWQWWGLWAMLVSATPHKVLSPFHERGWKRDSLKSGTALQNKTRHKSIWKMAVRFVSWDSSKQNFSITHVALRIKTGNTGNLWAISCL